MMKSRPDFDLRLQKQFTPMPDGAVAQIRLDLQRVLDSGCREEELHKFVAQNVYLLFEQYPSLYILAVSKPKLGHELVCDFCLHAEGNFDYWSLIELERADDRLFTKAGDPTQRLSHALRQVHEWQSWIDNHTEYFRQTYVSRFHWRPMVTFSIVIGRRADLGDRDIRMLQELNESFSGD